MAFDENIKTGQAYRVLVDTDPVTGKNTYDRISTWTAASDIEFSNNTILEAFVNSFRYAEGVLQAGRNSVTISGENITESGMLEIYVDDDYCDHDLAPTRIERSGNSVTLTFPVQGEDIPIRVVCNSFVNVRPNS